MKRSNGPIPKYFLSRDLHMRKATLPREDLEEVIKSHRRRKFASLFHYYNVIGAEMHSTGETVLYNVVKYGIKVNPKLYKGRPNA